MAKQVKYGMVGGHINAFIGDVHRKAIGFDTRAELVAGCFSTNSDLNAATGEEYSVDPSRVYTSYNEMAKAESSREDGIDFVSITVPNHIHYEVCKEFLEAGIHVVCEKPLCFEVWQAEELLKLSKEKNLILAVTYSYTGYTMVKVMREKILGGEIGDIVTINGEFAQEWLLDQLDPSGDGKELSTWRMDPKIAGISNSMGDLGTHVEHMVHYVTGLKIKRLLATTDTFGHPLDFNAYVLLEYENGIKGTYWSSQLAAGKLNGLVVRIYGTKGSLEWEQHYPDYLRYTPKNQPPQILSRGTGYLTGPAASTSRLPFGHPEGLFVGFANLYKNIISTVHKLKTGQSPNEIDLDFPTAGEGLNGVKFVHAVVESAGNDSAWVVL
ncbi:MAG: Gfo/Idh/MocA family oxidoreductase [Defluviitaleaceae bacterium]|nr:Gfo/Idh/MocA family oxidoreductase [Defluviitaleaceae bacterium]